MVVLRWKWISADDVRVDTIVTTLSAADVIL
jgi:hypothetical protein